MVRQNIMRRRIIIRSGMVLFVLGTSLRLAARWLAWPTHYSFSGERNNTEWAITEVALQQIACFIMALAVFLIASAAHDWLKSEK